MSFSACYREIFNTKPTHFRLAPQMNTLLPSIEHKAATYMSQTNDRHDICETIITPPTCT